MVEKLIHRPCSWIGEAVDVPPVECDTRPLPARMRKTPPTAPYSGCASSSLPHPLTAPETGHRTVHQHSGGCVRACAPCVSSWNPPHAARNRSRDSASAFRWLRPGLCTMRVELESAACCTRSSDVIKAHLFLIFILFLEKRIEFRLWGARLDPPQTQG